MVHNQIILPISLNKALKKAEIVECLVVIELKSLKGSEKLKPIPFYPLLQYDWEGARRGNVLIWAFIQWCLMSRGAGQGWGTYTFDPCWTIVNAVLFPKPQIKVGGGIWRSFLRSVFWEEGTTWLGLGMETKMQLHWVFGFFRRPKGVGWDGLWGSLPIQCSLWKQNHRQIYARIERLFTDISL